MMLPCRLPSPVALALLPLLVLLLLAVSACEDSFSDEGHITADELNGVTHATNAPASTRTATPASTNSPASPSTPSTPASEPTTPSTPASPSTPATPSTPSPSTEITGIRWLGPNISSWPVTTTLRASISGGTIHMKYNKANVWPVQGDVVANCWAIVNIGGTWYAGTFEYLRPGQTSKPTSVLDGSGGDHFKKQPLSSWRPQSGERFGLMVSGLCRSSARNVSERSNICMVTWP